MEWLSLRHVSEAVIISVIQQCLFLVNWYLHATAIRVIATYIHSSATTMPATKIEACWFYICI